MRKTHFIKYDFSPGKVMEFNKIL